MQREAVVAVIGRPNVGKSSFFNALAGERISITHDQPGVTRDRISTRIQWGGRSFMLIDTGGLDLLETEGLPLLMREQADLAVDTADLILFMVDVKAGLTAADQDIVAYLRKSGKTILLLVNKCDQIGDPPAEFFDFYQLGIPDVYAVSSAHRLGIGDVLDAIVAELPTSAAEEADGAIRVAIVGRPNAGKSSLLNRLAGEERAIVSDMAGTTRDAIDFPIHNDAGDFIFVDTAGLRRRSRIREEIERFSNVRALAAVSRADVCLLVLDAEDGVTEQDAKIAGYIEKAGKACLILVNKWDKIHAGNDSERDFRARIAESLAFIAYAPVLFISALTGRRCRDIYGKIKTVYAETTKRIATPVLNALVADAQVRVPPPQYKGRRLKISYVTQCASAPPCFLLFVNDKGLLHFSYERYLENRFREAFSFEGAPIRLLLREKGNVDERGPQRA